MTIRLCIFGNSHAAALRSAFMAQPGRWPGLSLTFLAAQKSHLLQTELRDGQLVATHPVSKAAFKQSCGRFSVTLADYDGFIIAGASVCLNAILPVYRDCRWVGLPSVAAAHDLGELAQNLLSAASATAVMRACLQDRLGCVFAARLRSYCTKPIFVTAQPRISQTVLTSPRPDTRLHNIAVRSGDAEMLGQAFDRIAKELLSDLACGYLPQPIQTKTHGILTQAQFMNAAPQLSSDLAARQPDGDVRHANGRYGALVIDQIVVAFAQGLTLHETAFQTGAGPDFARQRSGLGSTG